MILKITDGILTHYLDGFDEVRVTHVVGYGEGYEERDEEAEGVEPLCLWLDHEPSQPEPAIRNVVILQPTMGPKSLSPRTIITNFSVYLLNDQGKTVEVLHRAA